MPIGYSDYAEEKENRFHTLLGVRTMDGKLHFSVTKQSALFDEDEKLSIQFRCPDISKPERVQQDLALWLKKNNIDWLWRDGKHWFLNIPEVQRISGAGDFPWLSGFGVAEVIPILAPGLRMHGHVIAFELTEKYMESILPKRIFLSHKGVDKTMVRQFHATLKLLGFEPWLDEDAMVAGANVERALLQGMKDSCAAVFFLTDKFKDQNFLATEIDYAVKQKREKADRFAIIALVMDSSAKVPELLTPYVWKAPAQHLEALREVIKALPLRLPPPEWR
jgi:hypothetical protein